MSPIPDFPAPAAVSAPVTSSRIVFIGGGNMARSLVGGLIRASTPAAHIMVCEPDAGLRAALARDFNVATHALNTDVAHVAQVLVLAVKPQVMKTVCHELSTVVQISRPLVISIAAGIRMEQLEQWLGGNFPIVRSMPNTPALIGAGAIGMCANAHVSALQQQQAENILGAAGLTAWIENEALMDVVTALSGSGPAYFFALVEALENAAVAQGLPAKIAHALATQTCLGAGRMLREDGDSPEQLRKRVTSPGGTTERALQVLAAGGFNELIAHMLAQATARGRELSTQFGD